MANFMDKMRDAYQKWLDEQKAASMERGKKRKRSEPKRPAIGRGQSSQLGELESE